MRSIVCRLCGQSKPVRQFAWRNRAKRIKHGECKQCHNERYNTSNMPHGTHAELLGHIAKSLDDAIYEPLYPDPSPDDLARVAGELIRDHPDLYSVAPTSKYCKRCQRVKPVSAFSRHRRHRDGMQSQCRRCQSTISKQYREERRTKCES